ncbi:hypothetical protein BDZ89DRAFT_1138616 [Hymenopellis radicata]|nr:hypothetical protein BDZ89DRAFT_1138616 [Hymenopellis radicata]
MHQLAFGVAHGLTLTHTLPAGYDTRELARTFISHCGTDLVEVPTPGEYSRLCGTSLFPQLLRVTRQLFLVNPELNSIYRIKDMSGNAENSGNIEVPALPVNTLQEGEYTSAVENSIRAIIRRYGEKSASKAEIQATMSAYMGQVAGAGVFSFDAQRDLIPWYETLDAEVIRLDGAAKRGRRDDEEQEEEDSPDEEEGGEKRDKHTKRPRERTPDGSDLGRCKCGFQG